MATGEGQETGHDGIISHHLGGDLLVQRSLTTLDPVGPWTFDGQAEKEV